MQNYSVEFCIAKFYIFGQEIQFFLPVMHNCTYNSAGAWQGRGAEGIASPPSYSR